MVSLRPPPPGRAVAPIFCDVPVGKQLVRIFDPTRWSTTALTFRANGPRKRFDHHRGAGPTREPCDDPERAVYYTSWSSRGIPEAFASSFIEVFGDLGIVDFGPLMVVLPTVTRSLHLLDLRFHGAMRAGTAAAIAKCEHRLSQPWSRYFYETAVDFDAVDGLLYLNAHNDGPALCLYERASGALTCPDEAVARLDHPSLRPMVIDIMRGHSLTFSPSE